MALIYGDTADAILNWHHRVQRNGLYDDLVEYSRTISNVTHHSAQEARIVGPLARPVHLYLLPRTLISTASFQWEYAMASEDKT